MKQPSRTVWITGVRSGLGEALADTFSNEEWYVAGSSRVKPKKSARWLRGKHAVSVPMDVRAAGSVDKAWKKISKTAPPVELLINNAGITVFKDVLKTTPQEFQDIIDTNLVGLYHTARAVLPQMRRRKKGWIVNVLSFAAKTIYTKSGAYAASKAGAEMFMKVLREENRDAGIRVVNVFPGPIDTPMWSGAMRRDHGKTMMAPSDIARMILTLTQSGSNVIPEEVIIRPSIGDLTV
jgi:short-subunit dehydrogenase